MQAGVEAAFTFSGMLQANPHLADYYHYLSFSPAGTVKMHDAAGHLILSVVHGQFSVHPVDACSIQVRFYDLVEVNPYRAYQPVRELEPMRIQVTREEGVHAFLDHKAYPPRGTLPSEWPCLLYWTRYSFAVDPLASLASNRKGSAYFKIMVEPDTRYYYHVEDEDRDRLTVAEVTDLGISLQPDAHLKEEFKNKVVWGYRVV